MKREPGVMKREPGGDEKGGSSGLFDPKKGALVAT